MTGPGPVKPVVVALDALGAERGIAAVAEALRAHDLGDDVQVRAYVRPEDAEALPSGVAAVEVTDVIGNDEDPVRAVRSRDGASIVRAAADVAAGEADALVSPGSTGATLAAATFALKRAAGVARPALAVQLPAPGAGHPVLMLDAGANAEARPGHLLQFGFLGSAFASSVLGISEPRVGLLSVGSEAKKGSPLAQEAHAALAGAESLRFEGNVEGTGLLSGETDVVVTDGFTGNVTLKTIEGTAKAVGGAVGAAARSNPVSMLGGLLLRRSLSELRASMDPDGTGGAILLGLRRPAIVAHGSAGPLGIANAIRLAVRSVREDVPGRVEHALAAGSAGRAALRDRKDS